MGVKRLTYAGVALALLLASCAQQEQQQAARAPVPVKVAKVTKGNIQSTLSYSGELQPLDQVDIVPSSSGRLQEVFVEEGATVLAGAPLGQLETDTLQAQMRQAEANVLSVRSRLDTVLRGARPEEIAIAQAQLETQRSRLRAQVGVGGAGGIATARANLSAAAAALANAQAKLDQLLNPTAGDIAVAEATLAAATSNFNKAQAAYEQIKKPSAADIASAQSTLDNARSRYADMLDRPTSNQMQTAQLRVATARATIVDAQRKVDAYDAQLATITNGTAYKTAWATMNAARDRLALSIARNQPADKIHNDRQALEDAWRALEIAGREVPWGTLGFGEGDYNGAQTALQSANQALTDAQTALSDLDPVPSEEELKAAQSAVESAEARLNELLNPTASTMFSAEAAMESARSQQVSAQKNLGEVRTPSTTNLRAAEATVENAVAGRAAAEAAVSRAEADLQAQEAAVAQAEQQLSLVVDKYTSPDIAAATAAVAQAEASADLARIQLSKATLVAPFDAIIAKKNVSVGATVSQQTAVFTLVSQSLQAVFNGEEASLSRLRPGLAVNLTVAAFGEKAFKATVTSIAPVADSTSRTFRIKAIPAAGQDGLRAGMFANIVVTTESRDGVLLIPQEALVQRGQDTIVFVVKNNQAEQRKIEVGLRNDRFVQVRTGLEEGEEVVVQGNRTLRQQDSVTIIK